MRSRSCGFRKKRGKGVRRRLGALSHHHMDRGVHVSSSGVMATPEKSSNSSLTHCSVAGSVGLGAICTSPHPRITALAPAASSAVMALVALITQEGRGEPAIHPLEPPCLDEEIAALGLYGAPITVSARGMSRSGHSKFRKAPESDSRGAERSLRQEALPTPT